MGTDPEPTARNQPSHQWPGQPAQRSAGLINAWQVRLTELASSREPGGVMEEKPVTPHAAPMLDEEGRLTYIGNDGRRYVVLGFPPDIDDATTERVMESLRGSSGLFNRIERLCQSWLAQVSSQDLPEHEALVLLLTTLETSLEDALDEPDDDPDGSASPG